jgi:lipid-binding SYLF domain-containing protein
MLVTITTERANYAQNREEETVQAAAQVLNETLSSPMNRIPQSMLNDAYGVAIIPNVIKGSFVVGARHGRGLLFVREPNGVWHAPVFITLTGGNLGWQVGVQSSDIVLVFKTQRSVQGILNGKLTLGADAAAAAGPVGGQTGVGTDGRLQAEIYTYSRSRGLFAGVSIDGSVVSIDQLATGQYYRSPAPGAPVVIPPSAQQLTQTIASVTGTSLPGNTAAQSPSLAQQHAMSEADILRNQLIQLSPELFKMLDPKWQAYLALPSNMLNSGAHPDPASVQAVVNRYSAVASNPQYASLASRPEFQSVFGLLRHYIDSLAPSSGNLQLPPPPSTTTANTTPGYVPR